MPEQVQYVNADLYAHDLFDRWANEQGIIAAEALLIRTYFTDFTKSVLEAGTGGGRIAFYLEQLGFKDIQAFDIVPKMIVHARELAEKKQSAVQFQVANAADLSIYPDQQFDYLIYPQQVLCFIENRTLFHKALREAYRVAKPGSVCVFSFLDYDARWYNPLLSTMLTILRKVRHEKSSKYDLPWLKLNGAANKKFFHKHQPTLYWIRRHAILNELQQIGFKVMDVKNAGELENPEHPKRKGMLYITCTK